MHRQHATIREQRYDALHRRNAWRPADYGRPRSFGGAQSLDHRSYFDDKCRALFEQQFSRDLAAFGHCY